MKHRLKDTDNISITDYGFTVGWKANEKMAYYLSKVFKAGQREDGSWKHVDHYICDDLHGLLDHRREKFPE